MGKEQPSYYAIIPAEVRYANIPDKAKLLYGEITALCSKEGYCWANNTYFAELYGVHKNTISRLIGILVKKGFIQMKITKAEKGQKGVEVSRKLFIGRLKNVDRGINENADYITTSLNKTINKEKIYKKEEDSLDLSELFPEEKKASVTSNEVSVVIEYFNELFGTKYRVTPDRSKKIRLRLKTYTLEEIKTAINKCKASKFHRGENDTGWKAGIDFIVRNDEIIDQFLNAQQKPERPYFMSYSTKKS